MSRRGQRVAVLGAGVMGSATALYLARRGLQVSLFDAAAAPFAEASRWNEGKIHLGFLYSGDASLRTAEHLLPASLRFKPLVEELIGRSIDPAVTTSDDIYLCHRRSVVSAEAMGDYFRRVAALVRASPGARDYLADVSACGADALSRAELAAISDAPDIVAGFRAPERSVSTVWVADQFVAALAAEHRIELRMGSRVATVSPVEAGDVEGRWQVSTADGGREVFDIVVNALWAGRMAIDASAGLAPPDVWSNRYRASIFLRTAEPVDFPCVVVATGPFGDVKAYTGRDFYLSWYPDGLLVDSTAVTPPPPPVLDEAARERLCASILDHLQGLLPGLERVRANVQSMTLQGGWVFAAGRGALSDPRSTLHRRADFGLTRLGAYHSVDTGKYSSAPWLARRLAERLS